MDLIDIFRAFHTKGAEYKYFSSAHGTFFRIYMLGYKTSLNKFKKIEITPSIFSDQTAMKLGINHNKNTEKKKKNKDMEANSMLLNNERVNNKITEEIKRFLKINENEETTVQNLWETGKAILRGKFIALTFLSQKTAKAQINNPTLHLKELEKEHQTKPKVSRVKEIMKIRTEINEIRV